MKELLVTVKDKNKVNDIRCFGAVTYISKYTNLVGFECSEENVPQLSTHPNVVGFEEACTGEFCNWGGE